MTDKNISLPVSFSVNNEISDKNNRFINVTIDVLHTGLNYNGSIFSKEVVDENIETIKNTPILGFVHNVSFDDKDFKGHEYIIVKSENGVERKYVGQCFGIIPESCNPRWVTKFSDSGIEREYLQVDGILFSKFKDAVDIVVEDIEKPQSMELFPYDIEGYYDSDGNFVFDKFSFDGCCILGSTKEGLPIQPAMENANITINEVQFTMSEFVKSIQSELNDKLKTFTELKVVNEKTNQGGSKVQNIDFTQTLLAQFEEIANTVKQHETYTDKYGWECSRYYAVDVQESEVIVVDTKNNYNYFGLSFTMNGDKAEINFENAKRKKIQYEDYVEGTPVIEGAFDFGKFISDTEENAFAKIEEANTKIEEAEAKAVEFENKVTELEEAKEEVETNYTQIKAEFEEMKPKYEEFVAAEQARIDAELDAQKDAELAKYETALADCVEFEELKTKKSEMTAKEIESECALLFARRNLEQTNFTKSNSKAMTAGIVIDNNNEGFVVTKYGNIRIKQ